MLPVDAFGLFALGTLSLIHRDFALVWQPVPPGVPAREVLAIISGLILVGGGIGLCFTRSQRMASLVLAVFVTSWLLLLQLPRVIGAPADVGVWLGFCENAILVSGGWILFSTQRNTTAGAKPGFSIGANGVRFFQILYAIALPVIGCSHFAYAEFTASMVPGWLPFHLGFAYLTGTGHMAAGLGILLGVVPHLAASLEAAMLSSFVLLLHAPGVAHEPTSRMQWTMLAVATAYSGAAWIIANSIRTAPLFSFKGAGGR